jgi:hypothetical protein
MMQPDEWVTVATAAKRLGLSERQTRRLADSLPPEDRTESGIRPARVRWMSLQDRRESGGMSEGSDTQSQFTSDSRPAMSGESPASMSEDVRSLIEQLQSENTFLRAQLEERNVAESELRRLMLADKSEISKLRQQLALAPIQEAVKTEASLAGHEDSVEAQHPAESPPEADQMTQKNDPPVKKRNFWKWLFNASER